MNKKKKCDYCDKEAAYTDPVTGDNYCDECYENQYGSLLDQDD